MSTVTPRPSKWRIILKFAVLVALVILILPAIAPPQIDYSELARQIEYAKLADKTDFKKVAKEITHAPTFDTHVYHMQLYSLLGRMERGEGRIIAAHQTNRLCDMIHVANACLDNVPSDLVALASQVQKGEAPVINLQDAIKAAINTLTSSDDDSNNKLAVLLQGYSTTVKADFTNLNPTWSPEPSGEKADKQEEHITKTLGAKAISWGGSGGGSGDSNLYYRCDEIHNTHFFYYRCASALPFVCIKVTQKKLTNKTIVARYLEKADSAARSDAEDAKVEIEIGIKDDSGTEPKTIGLVKAQSSYTAILRIREDSGENYWEKLDENAVEGSFEE